MRHRQPEAWDAAPRQPADDWKRDHGRNPATDCSREMTVEKLKENKNGKYVSNQRASTSSRRRMNLCDLPVCPSPQVRLPVQRLPSFICMA